MPNTALDPSLAEPERSLRREELRVFAGPNASTFLTAFDKMVDQRQNFLQTRKIRFGQRVPFTWPALFIGPVWFFYRKMWVWGWGTTVGLLLLGLIPGVNRISLPIGIVLGAMAKRAYVDHAMQRINMLHAAGKTDEASLAAAGGVSPKAAWIAGGIFAVYMVLGVIALVLLDGRGR